VCAAVGRITAVCGDTIFTAVGTVTVRVETLICAALGAVTAVCGDINVCSCRDSKCCVWGHYFLQL